MTFNQKKVKEQVIGFCKRSLWGKGYSKYKGFAAALNLVHSTDSNMVSMTGLQQWGLHCEAL